MSQDSKSKNIPDRPDKTIAWLGKSRDEWKNKTSISKAALKVSKQAQKRSQASRVHWKEQYKQMQIEQENKDKELVKKGTEIEKLKAQLIQLEQEKEDLKKKFLFQTMILE